LFSTELFTRLTTSVEWDWWVVVVNPTQLSTKQKNKRLNFPDTRTYNLLVTLLQPNTNSRT